VRSDDRAQIALCTN